MTLAAAQVIDVHAARLTGLPLTGSRVFTTQEWAKRTSKFSDLSMKKGSLG